MDLKGSRPSCGNRAKLVEPHVGAAIKGDGLDFSEHDGDFTSDVLGLFGLLDCQKMFGR